MNGLIRIDETGNITARELYEFLQLHPAVFARWAKTNIEDNEFYQECTDWHGFNIMLNGNEAKDYSLTIDFAKHLCMLSRSERGKQARNYFCEVERRYQSAQLPSMTQTQLIAAMAQQAVEQEQKLIALESRTETVERRLTLVKDTIVQRDDNWRENMNSLMNKVTKRTDNKNYQEVRAESYRILEERAGCDLNTRQRNLKQRLEESGATKSKINSVTKMDVIESDKRLKEIYTGIVKELVIKYVA